MTTASNSSTSGVPAASPPALTGTTSVARLAVEGMHCGSCVALIEETLGEQDGVTSASVDLESARAVVEYDPSQLDLDEIRAAIADAGYTTTPVS
jgi:copper ion binding protein